MVHSPALRERASWRPPSWLLASPSRLVRPHFLPRRVDDSISWHSKKFLSKIYAAQGNLRNRGILPVPGSRMARSVATEDRHAAHSVPDIVAVDQYCGRNTRVALFQGPEASSQVSAADTVAK